MPKASKKDRFYGELIIDLVNATTREEAMSRLIENVQELFGFSPRFVETEKARILGFKHKDAIFDLYDAEIERLKTFLKEFFPHRNVSKTKDFSHFAHMHDFIKSRDVVCDDKGDIYEILYLEEKTFGQETYKFAIGYCLVRFFMNPVNRELINRCEECNNYYISKRQFTHLKPRFCSSKCRYKWNNRRRTESGEAKEYKRRRYQEEGKYKY